MSKVFDGFIDDLGEKTGYSYDFLVDKFSENVNNLNASDIDKFIRDALVNKL